MNLNDTILNELEIAKSRAGWVLVGGQSRRMGEDKALLPVAGRPLALRVADAAAAVCNPVTLVGDPARYAALGLPVIPDEFAGSGPLSGIETALRVTSAAWNLVLACDIPALDTALLETLFEEGGDCAIPQYEDGRVEPLCAVYHRRCHAAIREALDAGVRKVTDALRGLAIRYVPMENDAAFANLNTPDDLRRYTRLLKRRSIAAV